MKRTRQRVAQPIAQAGGKSSQYAAIPCKGSYKNGKAVKQATDEAEKVSERVRSQVVVESKHKNAKTSGISVHRCPHKLTSEWGARIKLGIILAGSRGLLKS
jgi:hypothetical protein